MMNITFKSLRDTIGNIWQIHLAVANNLLRVSEFQKTIKVKEGSSHRGRINRLVGGDINSQ